MPFELKELSSNSLITFKKQTNKMGKQNEYE